MHDGQQNEDDGFRISAVVRTAQRNTVRVVVPCGIPRQPSATLAHLWLSPPRTWGCRCVVAASRSRPAAAHSPAEPPSARTDWPQQQRVRRLGRVAHARCGCAPPEFRAHQEAGEPSMVEPSDAPNHSAVVVEMLLRAASTHGTWFAERHWQAVPAATGAPVLSSAHDAGVARVAVPAHQARGTNHP